MKRLAPLIVAIPILSLVALSLGAADVDQLTRYLFNPFFDTQSSSHQIIWEIRAPRIAAAPNCGAVRWERLPRNFPMGVRA